MLFILYMFSLCLCLINNLELPVQQCVTPDRKRGGCIDLRQCAVLFNLIQKPGISYEDRNFLRQSQCAYINNYPWVNFTNFHWTNSIFCVHLLVVFSLLLQVCCPYDANPATNPPSPTNPQNAGDPGAVLRASDLPAPGICGFSVDDRIVGGNETR